MSRISLFLFLSLLSFPGGAASLQGPAGARNARDALQPFNEIIGRWKGTGIPAGSQEEAEKGFWMETVSWSWKFHDRDAWLTVDFDGGKHFVKGALRYQPGKKQYQLTIQTVDKETLTFAGPLRERRLILKREDAATRETQQLVIRLLHADRFLYTYAVRPPGRTVFRKVYQVGATREGVAFAGGDTRPKCIVSGGLGTIPVVYQGKTYYVCCSGCRDEFRENPEKYIRESEQRKDKK